MCAEPFLSAVVSEWWRMSFITVHERENRRLIGELIAMRKERDKLTAQLKTAREAFRLDLQDGEIPEPYYVVTWFGHNIWDGYGEKRAKDFMLKLQRKLSPL